MDSLLSFPISLVFTFFVFLLALRYLLYDVLYTKKSKGNAAPQAAGAWPIFGHLPLLSGSQLPHVTLGSMADKYGPIFTVKLGVQQTVLVSDPELAKECFTTNDKVFASRPKSMVVEVMGYNYAMFGLSPYGQYWRQVRKIVVLELLSQRRIEMLSHIRVSEVNASIKEIFEVYMRNKESVVRMEMKEWFGDLVLNVIVRMISGKRFSTGDEEKFRFQQAVRKFFERLGSNVIADAIPSLRWFDLGGHEKSMKLAFKEMDSILDVWLDEHKNKKCSGQHTDGKQQDFMDVMISILDGASQEDFSGFGQDVVVKATCLAMLTAASDTTTVTLTWAIALLLNNPEALIIAKQELDTHVGRDRKVQESDMKNLVYLQAIIKETLRLYPAGPLSVPHESMEDCTVGGYDIPRGTRLMVNIWKIHHDPTIWPEPYKFQPDRFLTTKREVDVRGQHFELIPFGSGRRMCPGISFATQAMQLALACLIQAFDLGRPTAELIDMTESFGLTNLKATPLEVLLTPRVSPSLYN